MNILLEPALSGQVPSFQSKNWIGNLLKMNYFEFSFRENEISAGKLCMATAGLQLIRRAGLQDSAILLNFLTNEEFYLLRNNIIAVKKQVTCLIN